jgi:Thiol:disulfide interchange protein
MRRYFITLLTLFSVSVSALAQAPVSWSFQHKDNGDGTIDLIFKAEIEDPWYIYSTEKISGGPLQTTFDISNPIGFEPIGSLQDGTSPKVKMDEGFGLEVKVFEHTASFIQKIKRTSDGELKVTGLFMYQSCNGGECMLDEFDASFTIPAGGAVSSASSASSTAGSIPDSDKSLLWFLLIAFGAGLAGVFTPCVFPMIPMTISFFISGDSAKKNAGIMKGIIFGLSVTLIYTLIGVLVALFQSTSATDILGTHWIPNLLFALLFITFAISFFGAFEITLPSGLANKADAQADKGGYIAAFFVAVAMVIVSFSCTGPFVGSILAASVTGGLALKPVMGMLFFGLGFSLPFVLFSAFPSLMKKMPKSGGWLNVVKVVFAFILFAFSFKYLASVDAYFGWGIFNRAVVLCVWIVLSVMLGIYFLGKLKLSHDSDVPHVSTWRLILAFLSFFFAIYLLPGLFGAPLNSLSGLLPPKDGSTIEIGAAVAPGGAITTGALTQGLCGEAKYAASNNIAPYGLNSYYEVEQALECSKELGKPVLLSFKSHTCSGCKVMEANVWSNPDVLEILRNDVIIATLYIDDRTELPENEQVVSTIDGKVKNTLGRKLRDYQVSRYNVASQPFYVLVDATEQSLTTPVAECSVETFLSFLKSGLESYNNR